MSIRFLEKTLMTGAELCASMFYKCVLCECSSVISRVHLLLTQTQLTKFIINTNTAQHRPYDHVLF